MTLISDWCAADNPGGSASPPRAACSSATGYAAQTFFSELAQRRDIAFSLFPGDQVNDGLRAVSASLN